jgi:uncharacterized caspase-like protein
MSSLRIRRLLPLFLSIVALVSGTGTAGAQAPQQGTLHVLAVGVNGQQDRRLGQLRYADKDARDLAALFRGQEGKLFGRVQVRTLTNADATRAHIRTELHDVERSAQPGDLVVVFLSGHGGRGFFGTWSFEAYDAALTASDLRAPLSVVAARRVPVLVFLDTCHAGALNLSSAGIAVFASSRGNESSYEFRSRSNGLYTIALMEGLSGMADRDQDGTISLEELNGYLKLRVSDLMLDLYREHRALPNNQQHQLHLPATQNAQLALAQVSGRL